MVYDDRPTPNMCNEETVAPPPRIIRAWYVAVKGAIGDDIDLTDLAVSDAYLHLRDDFTAAAADAANLGAFTKSPYRVLKIVEEAIYRSGR